MLAGKYQNSARRLATRQDHAARFRLARQRQWASLEKPTPNSYGQSACYSPAHFAEIFTAFTGETPGNSLRRQRLDAAAVELRFSTRSVIDVALRAGFDSHEGFTRAFRKRFGCSPSQFRKLPSNKLRLPMTLGFSIYRHLAVPNTDSTK